MTVLKKKYFMITTKKTNLWPVKLEDRMKVSE